MISTELPPLIGGIGIYTQGIVSAMEMLKHHVVVVTSVPNGVLLSGSDSPILRPVQDQKKYIKLVPLYLKANQVIKSFQPDFVFALTWPHEGLLAKFLKYRYQIPYILFVHGSDILRHQDKPTRYLMKSVVQQAKLCISNSKFTQKLLEPLAPSKVIYPYFNRPMPSISQAQIETFKNQHQINKGLLLLTVSRLTPRKGHARIICLLPKLILKFPELIYIYTGDSAYGEQLKELAVMHGVQEHVKALGFVDELALSILYQISDIYVSPAQADDEDVEGFGISFLEASAYGLPIIAGQSGGSVEAVQDKETGVLVDDTSDDMLLTVIFELLSNKTKRKTLGENGRQRVLREFSIESQANKLQDVFELISTQINQGKDD